MTRDPRLPRDRWLTGLDHPDQPTKPPSDSAEDAPSGHTGPRDYGQQAVRAAIAGETVPVIDALDHAKLVAYAGGRGFADSLSIRLIAEPIDDPSDLPPAA